MSPHGDIELEGVSDARVDLNPGGESAVTVSSAVPLAAETVAAALDGRGTTISRGKPRPVAGSWS